MDSKDRLGFGWRTVVALTIIFISIVVIQIRPDSVKSCSQTSSFKDKTPKLESYPRTSYLKEQTPQIDDNLQESNSLDQTPTIEAIGISFNGESYISSEGILAREGDEINGFKILNIYPDKVEFYKNGKTITGVITSTKKYTKSNSYNSQQRSSFINTNYNYSSSYINQYKKPSYSDPFVAENDSYYGQISENTGRPKTVYVNGYYRKDGTYVRSHYRSPPK